MRRFPKNFYFGTATSAHQIEGNNTHNDWWKAEQEGKLPYKSGAAADSYSRYEEDFDLAKQMHTNAHRFSIEWSRIEPEEGKFNEKEIEHYHKVIRALRDRDIEPFVTLHHFTNPTWFSDKGGWANKKAPIYFERYTRFVADRIGEDVRYWITINEPLIINSAGYLSGRWPPFRRHDIRGFFRANLHMTEAHKRAYTTIHHIVSQAQVGIAKNNNDIEAGGGFLYIANTLLAFVVSYFKNFLFLDRIRNHQDFIGLNYYNHYHISVLRGLYQGGGEQSDFGCEIYPEGIYHVSKELYNRYKKSIYIMENGIADSTDQKRSAFIRDHLLWLQKAIEEGVDVRGYFHWSLLDNFEWTEGFTKRFGLVAVDFETQKRTLRPSANIYGEIARTKTLP